MTPSPSTLAAEFVAEHLRDWIEPYGPVMVGDVRTTARGKLVRELAKLIEEARAAAAPNPMDTFMALASANGHDVDPAHVAQMRAYLEQVAP